MFLFICINDRLYLVSFGFSECVHTVHLYVRTQTHPHTYTQIHLHTITHLHPYINTYIHTHACIHTYALLSNADLRFCDHVIL